MAKNTTYLFAFILALCSFLVARPAVAQLMDRQVELSGSIDTGMIDIGVETVNGYSQVYYEANKQRVFVTSGNENSHQPHRTGQYIVWTTLVNGVGQIFRYDILSDSKIQITSSLNNQNPRVSKEGLVVWEGWDVERDNWQVKLFDGLSTKNISNPEEDSINPQIDGDMVVFSSRGADRVWQSNAYLVSDQSQVTVLKGEDSKFLQIEGRTLYMVFPGQGRKQSEVSLSDAFLKAGKNLSTPNVPVVQPSYEQLVEQVTNLLDESSDLIKQSSEVIEENLDLIEGDSVNQTAPPQEAEAEEEQVLQQEGVDGQPAN